MEKYSKLIEWLKKYSDASKVDNEAYQEGFSIFSQLSNNRSILRFLTSRTISERHKRMLHTQLTYILKNNINTIKPEVKPIAVKQVPNKDKSQKGESKKSDKKSKDKKKTNPQKEVNNSKKTEKEKKKK